MYALGSDYSLIGREGEMPMSETQASSVLILSLGYENRVASFKGELGGVEDHPDSGMPGPHFRRGTRERRGKDKVRKIGSIFKIHSKN